MRSREMVWGILVLLALPLHATTFKFFGSAGAESQLTPANAASPLLHGNTEAIAYRTNSGDATLFLEAAPESKAWKIHVKGRADGAERSGQSLTAGEAFVQISPRPWLDITAGRVIEKWGTGYAWNPTGFVSPKKNPSDPTDRRSAYEGVTMVRADFFAKETSVSVYALERGAFAAKAYRMVGGTDVSLHFLRDRNGTKQGLSLARVIGDSLELHAEVSRRHGLIGGQYTLPHNINVVAELYHGGDGLSGAGWDSFRERLSSVRDGRGLLALNGEYRPLMMGRNYSFLRVAWPAWIDSEVIAITSLRDASSLIRMTFSRKLRPNVSLYVIDTEFAGSRGSELAYMQVRRVTTIGLRCYF